MRTSVSGLGRTATILLALDAATALLAVGLLAWRHSLLTRLYPMPGPPPAPPTRNAWAVPDPVPAQDRIPAAETESPEVPEIKPAEEPGDRLTPPS